MKTFKIQPKQRADGTLPYPYFVDEKGFVGRQEFWKGSPFVLIGFNTKPVNEYDPLSINLLKFVENPSLAIGKYPIFAHKLDPKNSKHMEWFTYQDPIAEAHVVGD